MLEVLSGYIIHLIQSLGYVAVFLFMTLESCLIPIPSEITLPFTGFLAQQGTFNLIIAIGIATLGDVVGTLLAYAIGYYLEEEVIVGHIDRFGKYILLTRREYDHVMHWMQTKGTIIITIAKLLPGFRTVIGLPAGLSEIPLKKVIPYTLVGSLIWCSAFVYVGYALGSKWNSLEPVFRKFELGIVALLVLGVLFYVNYKLKIVKFGKK